MLKQQLKTLIGHTFDVFVQGVKFWLFMFCVSFSCWYLVSLKQEWNAKALVDFENTFHLARSSQQSTLSHKIIYLHQ